MSQPQGTGTRLLAVITVILAVAALKLTKPVTLPVVLAIFLVILVTAGSSRSISGRSSGS